MGHFLTKQCKSRQDATFAQKNMAGALLNPDSLLPKGVNKQLTTATCFVCPIRSWCIFFGICLAFNDEWEAQGKRDELLATWAVCRRLGDVGAPLSATFTPRRTNKTFRGFLLCQIPMSVSCRFYFLDSSGLCLNAQGGVIVDLMFWAAIQQPVCAAARA